MHLAKRGYLLFAFVVVTARPYAQDASVSQGPNLPQEKRFVIIPSAGSSVATQLEEAIGTRIANSRGFRLLENEKRDELVKALLGGGGLTDQTQAIEKGKMYQISTILYVHIDSVQTHQTYHKASKTLGIKTGAYTDYTVDLTATIKVSDVKTSVTTPSQFQDSLTANTPDQATQNAISNVADQFMGQLLGTRETVQATVVDRDPREHQVLINIGGSGRLKEGDIFEVGNEESRTTEGGSVRTDFHRVCYAQVAKIDASGCWCYVGTMKKDFFQRKVFSRDDKTYDKVQMKMVARLN